jgi:hypothetical protein
MINHEPQFRTQLLTGSTVTEYRRAMETRSSAPTFRTYAGVVAGSAGDAVMAGVWLAAGELTPGRRRLARAGLMFAMAALGFGLSSPEDELDGAASDDESADSAETAGEMADEAVDEPDDPTETEPPGVSPLVTTAVATAGGGLAMAIMVGSSVLQKRWLERLHQSGHPHPHRALAVRVAVLSFVGTLPGRLLEVHGAGSKQA